MEAVGHIGNEPENDELVIEISEIVERQLIQSSSDCRIHKVPYYIRKWNSEAYTPQVISVGPFHHGNQRLEDMEEVKERYFSSFVRRSNLRLGDLVHKVRGLEEKIRKCYDGTIGISSDRFVKMILVDAGFILELLFRHGSSSSFNLDNPMAVEPRAPAIILDLILLENQIPFFVIEELYNLASPFLPDVPTLLVLCFDYFAQFNICDIAPHAAVNIEHFTDLLRTFRIPPLAERPERGYGMVSRLYTPKELGAAGVRFKRGARRSCLYLKFEKGVLEIPTTVLGDLEEVIARNIIALEQTRYIKDGYYTDYFIFMDLFIRTGEDVDLLSYLKIFSNLLSDGNAAVTMIKNLTRGIIWTNVNKEYADLCRRLNEYYEVPWRTQRAVIVRNYCHSPSAAAKVAFTVVVLTLFTFIQTVCNILQLVG